MLHDTFHTGDPNLVLLVTAHHGTVDDPVVAAEGRALTRSLAAEGDIGDVASTGSCEPGSSAPAKA